MAEAPTEVFEKIWAQAAKMFSPDSFAIALCGPDPGVVTYELLVEQGIRKPRRTRELGEGLGDLLLRTRGPVLVRNFEMEKGSVPLSWMGAPMMSGDRVLGFLSAQCFQQAAFAERDLATLGILAQWAASALEWADQCGREGRGEYDLSEVKSRLISTISHELRTPLSLIQSGTELLMGSLQEPEKLQQMAGLVHQGSLRLAEVVDDIIEFADLQTDRIPLALVEANPVSVVRDAVEHAAGAARASRVRLEAPDDLPAIRMDSGKVRSVVVKLVRNALNFSPESSQVLVRLSLEGGRLKLEVSDHGFGIPAQEMKLVFEPFFRGHVSQTACIPGTGLGLSIVKHLVEAMGGKINLLSESGNGTTAVVSVPVDGPQPS